MDVGVGGGGGANPCQSYYAIVFIINYFTLHLEQEHIYISKGHILIIDKTSIPVKLLYRFGHLAVCISLQRVVNTSLFDLQINTKYLIIHFGNKDSQ